MWLQLLIPLVLLQDQLLVPTPAMGGVQQAGGATQSSHLPQQAGGLSAGWSFLLGVWTRVRWASAGRGRLAVHGEGPVWGGAAGGGASPRYPLACDPTIPGLSSFALAAAGADDGADVMAVITQNALLLGGSAALRPPGGVGLVAAKAVPSQRLPVAAPVGADGAKVFNAIRLLCLVMMAKIVSESGCAFNIKHTHTHIPCVLIAAVRASLLHICSKCSVSCRAKQTERGWYIGRRSRIQCCPNVFSSMLFEMVWINEPELHFLNISLQKYIQFKYSFCISGIKISVIVEGTCRVSLVNPCPGSRDLAWPPPGWRGIYTLEDNQSGVSFPLGAAAFTWAAWLDFTSEQLQVLREAGSSQPLAGLSDFNLCKQTTVFDWIWKWFSQSGQILALHLHVVYRV